MRSLRLVCVAAFLLFNSCGSEPRWYRGNLHTHTLWSDGDQFPEVVVAWYRDRGYDFLVVSDHNTVADGDRWVVPDGPAGLHALAEYRALFPGSGWIEERPSAGMDSVRLKRFDEYRPGFDSPAFLLMLGEEITSHFESNPIHVNATNVMEFIEPREGNSVAEVMQRNVDAVLEQRARTGQPMFPHINHPNFGWAVTAEDLMSLEGERFFEVYNGHPLVHNEGDAARPGTERIWDLILARRLLRGDSLMYGVAVDDAHHYLDFGPAQANPGRGWVAVRAGALTAGAIIAAMEAGDFYGSSGVGLLDVRMMRDSFEIVIDAEPGVTYRTEFIGTLAGFDTTSTALAEVDGQTVTRRYSSDIGAILATVEGETASYGFTGREMYVRARVTSSRPKENPYRAGEFERAWVQPIIHQRPEGERTR